jgi:hypothetical protein
MYLTAQHVVSSDGSAGINAFHYQHGPLVWQGLPPPGIPDLEPGTLVNQSVVVEPPGNRVRSYLDVIAPDETPVAEIRQAFIGFLSEAQPTPLPWAGVSGSCFFRLSMERTLAAHWQREVALLYHAVIRFLNADTLERTLIWARWPYSLIPPPGTVARRCRRPRTKLND